MLNCSAALPLDRIMKTGDGQTTRADVESLSQEGFALAIQLLGRHEDAADVVQNSLSKLVHSGQFDAQRGPKRAWFLKVVRNGALDVLRKRKPADEEAVAQLTDRAPSPAEAVEHRELRQLIREELDQMEVAQREIVLLRDFHHLSYAEIADVMEIRAGTVMSRLHRARKELRNRMRKYLS
tara:strand:- start:552 stop:1094 length:543 start_codon:yes stop_codon:yes gene_type:complete